MRNSANKLDGWRVLLVDNDVYSLDILESLMHFFGAVTFSKINGEDGLQSAKQDKPDFIITDISMPILDGWDMIKSLKTDAATRDIPIIALTAHAMAGDQEKAVELGCSGYILKPLQPAKFLDQLLGILSQSPQFSARFGQV